MLELKNICKTFNPGTINAKSALNDLSLTLADGDFVTVIGGNGVEHRGLARAVAAAGVWRQGLLSVLCTNDHKSSLLCHLAFVGTSISQSAARCKTHRAARQKIPRRLDADAAPVLS